MVGGLAAGPLAAGPARNDSAPGTPRAPLARRWLPQQNAIGARGPRPGRITTILEQIMPNKASYKSKGGNKDSATKHEFNPSPGQGPIPDTTKGRATEEQDVKHRTGQFSDAGNPPLMKK